MQTSTIGLIGCGQMGGAILSGLAEKTPHLLMGYDPNPQTQKALKAKGITIAQDVPTLVKNCDIIILAVKPWLVETLLSSMQSHLTTTKLLISVAAGVSMNTLQDGIAHCCPVIRCMPNTPALVGAGVFAFCCEDPFLTDEYKQHVFSIFENIGTCLELPEKQFTAFSALIGAGPAYVFHVMNALVQAGVTMGFSRTETKRMVQALFAGSTNMAVASEQCLTELRDNVCSPAGLTIAGVNHLERMAISGHIVDAVLLAEKRGKEMEN